MKTTTCNFMNPAWQYDDMDGLSRKVNPNNDAFCFAEVRLPGSACNPRISKPIQTCCG